MKWHVETLNRTVDKEAYDDGGLTKITREDTADNIKKRKNVFIVNRESRFVLAAKRLDILSSGNAHVVFASDVFYHQSSCIKFLILIIKISYNFH